MAIVAIWAIVMHRDPRALAAGMRHPSASYEDQVILRGEEL